MPDDPDRAAPRGRRKHFRLETLVDGALVALALYLTLQVINSGREERRLVDRDDWHELTSIDAVLGATRAKTTLVEFVDYQCPACAVAEGVLSEIEATYPGQLRRIILHFPLTRNVRSDTAAMAAECARKAGTFERMHAVLFASRVAVAQGAWDSLAVLAGVEDLAGFRRCLESGEVVARVQRDLRLARRLGVAATPSLILDRMWLDSPAGITLRTIVREKLQ